MPKSHGAVFGLQIPAKFGDGLIDILVGYCYLQSQRDGRQGMRGYVYWYENIGLPEFPLFGVGEQLTLQDGTPLDAWESTCPFVVDWTCDGVQDLVVGDGGQGKIYFYTNVGTNREPVLVGTSEYEHGPVRVNESSW